MWPVSMIKISLFSMTILFAFTPLNAAVTIVECEDKEGNRSFQTACPPGSVQVDKKRIRTGESKSKQHNIQAILYMIPNCDSCDEIREFLNARDIPVTEKNVSDDITLQKEISDLTGGLNVPVTVIGETVLTGYNRPDLLNALKLAGYKEDS